MKNFKIQMQYGEHVFTRVQAAATIREALIAMMIYIRRELCALGKEHIIVSIPNKTIVKVGSSL